MTPTELQVWMRDTVVPYWWENGLDRNNGGYFELLAADGTPVERARRARLTARQIYSFAVAGKLGWAGDSREAVDHGLVFLLKHLVSEAGEVVCSVDPFGTVVDRGPDLYDDAFVLFALATVIEVFGRDATVEAIGRRVAERMVATRKDANGAFRDGDGTYLANPMMHLTEAFLAWSESGADEDGYWRGRSAEIIDIARNRMIKPDFGVIPEVFGTDWAPVPDGQGLLIEPGHQFEWGWLLARWSVLTDDPEPFAEAMVIARSAESHGIAEDGIVFEALDECMRPRDRSARLWPQAERAKFWHAVAHHPFATDEERAVAPGRRDEALTAIAAFAEGAPSGLWHETRLEGGGFADEPTRASSLYHIICAAVVVNRPGIGRT